MRNIPCPGWRALLAGFGRFWFASVRLRQLAHGICKVAASTSFAILMVTSEGRQHA